MKKNIQATVIKSKEKLFTKIVEVDLSENNGVKDLIDLLKTKINNLDKFTIDKEELYFGTQLMKPEESVPAENGIKLKLILK